MNKEFVFERDTGIMFQRAKVPEQPLKLKNNQFTNIPRLESVNAEEYNRQFEEMIRSMPKNLAYSAKFGTESIIPPGVSSKTPRHQPQKPAAIERPAKEIKKSAAVISEPEKTVIEKPAPKPVSKPAPKPEPKKSEPPVQDDEPIVFYTGYEQTESDPFNDSSRNKEIIIKGETKKQTGSFKDRFVNTFHKLFSTPAEDEFPDDSFE